MKYEGLFVGQVLRNLRIEKRMTIEKFSEVVDKSPSHINQIELGSRKMSIDLLYAFMTALDTDANCVLGIPYKIRNTQNCISVDEKLMRLNEGQRNYLTNIFVEMIEKIPA